jgi:hypothetical protein
VWYSLLTVIKLLSVNYFMVNYLAIKGVRKFHIRLITCNEMNSLEHPKFALLVKNLRAFKGTQKFIRAPSPPPVITILYQTNSEHNTNYSFLLKAQHLPR